MSKLPIYDITIDDEFSNGEDLGISMIAFTAKPAIIVKGVAFETQEPLKMFFADETKMRVVAPVMIPMEIYRNDDGEEYYTRFTADVIEQLHAKFMKDLTNRDIFNYGHDTDKKVPAYILETWIVDSPKTDKAFTTYGIEVPKGTLMAIAQVTDKDYYQSLVDRQALGFSIEGYLGMKQKEEFSNQNSMKLPDGEHLIEGKIYVVKDGEVVEIKDVPVEASEDKVEEEPKEEQMAEDMPEEETKEEELAEEPATETPTIDEAKVVEIVQPMIDEVLRIVADLKSQIEEKASDDSEEVEMKQEYNAHDRLKAFLNFNKQTKTK